MRKNGYGKYRIFEQTLSTSPRRERCKFPMLSRLLEICRKFVNYLHPAKTLQIPFFGNL